MDIKRYDHMPFYFYPYAKQWISYEDTIITFLDWMVDAHEQERNSADHTRSFYQRSIYVYNNFLRYQNDTMANLMYDSKLRRVDYDRYNSLISQKQTQFYLATSTLHTVGFMYLAYFFRFRRVGLPSTFVISAAYYYFFTKTNNITYKWFIDRNIINLARESGHEKHIQPVGHFKNRGLNFVWNQCMNGR